MSKQTPSFLEIFQRLLNSSLVFIFSSIEQLLQKNRQGFLNLKQNLDYYLFVIDQYKKFYSIKENQQMLKQYLTGQFLAFISRQKYRIDEKKDELVSNFHNEKFRLQNKLNESRYKLLDKADELKYSAEKILSKK